MLVYQYYKIGFYELLMKTHLNNNIHKMCFAEVLLGKTHICDTNFNLLFNINLKVRQNK